MVLSNDLLSQFAKITNTNRPVKKESTIYGTVKEYDGELYVQMDGSELLTPVTTTSDMKNGERVIVQLKDHSATIIGNITSPSASSMDVTEANKIIVNMIEAGSAKIVKLEADSLIVNDRLTATEADIKKLQADIINTTNLEAINAKITNLEAEKLDASVATITYATIDSLTAVNGAIEELQTNKLDATSADIRYADINFTNIGMTSVGSLFTKSGIIKDLVVGDTSITGELTGVTIRGDLIIGNTIVADKLVVQGEDGLYYKLNTDGMKVEAEQTEFNSLDGSILISKSITASKINVNDLSAFNATIGGFKLTENSIYSGVKTTVDNTTNGIYLDNQGQISFGNASNFVKYYKDQNGNYKLEISADNINLSSTSITTTLTDLQNQIDRIYERFE